MANKIKNISVLLSWVLLFVLLYVMIIKLPKLPADIVYDGIYKPYGYIVGIFLETFMYVLIALSALLVRGNETFFGYTKIKRITLILLSLTSLMYLAISIHQDYYIKAILFFIVILVYSFSNFFNIKRFSNILTFVPIPILVLTVLSMLKDFSLSRLLLYIALFFIMTVFMNSQANKKSEVYDDLIKQYNELYKTHKGKKQSKKNKREPEELKEYEESTVIIAGAGSWLNVEDYIDDSEELEEEQYDFSDEAEYMKYLNEKYEDEVADIYEDEEACKQSFDEIYDTKLAISTMNIIKADRKRIRLTSIYVFAICVLFISSTLLSLYRVDLYRLSYINSFNLRNGLYEELEVSYKNNGENIIIYDSKDYGKGTKFDYIYLQQLLNYTKIYPFIGVFDKSECININAEGCIDISIYPRGKEYVVIKYVIDGEMPRYYIIHGYVSYIKSEIFRRYGKISPRGES